MIPITLSISGFLSYRDPVEIDFTPIELACISGSNGAGKSSLLDAITWVLFGQARKRDDSLIHTAANTADVTLVFEYEGNRYKVQRTLPRGKTSTLEFHIAQSDQRWKPLTEATIRATQSQIEETLRLDYDTFVNASFFLQGKADQFTQQRPADRKRILASILGLETWEAYRLRSAEKRKGIEDEIAVLDGRLSEIATELSEEETRKDHLAVLNQQLAAIMQTRQTQEKNLENVRKMSASLDEQRKLVDSFSRQLNSATARLDDLATRLNARYRERESHTEIVARTDEIQAAYQVWELARQELAAWDTSAEQFRQHEKRRQPFLDELNAAKAMLEQEQKTLTEEQSKVEREKEQLSEFKQQLAEFEDGLKELEGRLTQRAELEAQLTEARQRQADARAENPRLKDEMEELKERIDQLAVAEGAECPLCGQALNPDERQGLIEKMTNEGTEMGNRFRANQVLGKELDNQIASLEEHMSDFTHLEQERLAKTQAVASLTTRTEQVEDSIRSWIQNGELRLTEVAQLIQKASYNPETREALAAIDAELAELGYEAAAHDAVRLREEQGRSSGDELRALERSQAALAPIDREIEELQTAQHSQTEELSRLQEEHDAAASALAAAESSAPDLYTAERELLAIQENENQLRTEVGAAQQKVNVLDDLKTRRTTLSAQREELARQVTQYKQLERAFGKDGVPALLIEQALPQIEESANQVLERLTNGSMTISFITQASYKDKRRKDLRETLDIQIADSAGVRDYEMFSGGEAFRVNFAIRLALSEVLSQRAGARLQTIVIDEGFGSQDALGRQRLIEAINTVKDDFAKILVITHIEELKDAFPNRIEVEKTDRGSAIQIV